MSMSQPTAATVTAPPNPLTTQIEQAGFTESRGRIKGATWTWVKGETTLTLVQKTTGDYVISNLHVTKLGTQKASVSCFS
jgi:hypothetical protein